MRKLPKNEFSQPLPDYGSGGIDQFEHSAGEGAGSEDIDQGGEDFRSAALAGATLEDDRLLLQPVPLV